ncbi:MAG TPA: hypothetical protein VGV57_09135 [Thermoleophilaceae bacterium]|nr:hypothetical protein [Thermoleophilaceae bacterium]
MRDVVADRRVAGVTDRRYDGYVAGKDRTTEALVVEGDQILNRAAAAGDNHDVDERVVLEVCNRVDDVARRRLALGDR